MLFGSPTEDRLLTTENNEVYSIQEKITIQFRSSLNQLREYFKRVFYIPIDIYCDNVLISMFKIFEFN